MWLARGSQSKLRPRRSRRPQISWRSAGRAGRTSSRGRGRTDTTTVPGRTSNPLTTCGWYGGIGLYMKQGPLWVRVPPVVRDLQKGVRGYGDLTKDPGVRAVRPPPRRQGPQVPQHEGHVGPVLLRRDVCHVCDCISSGADRPRAALAEQAKGPGFQLQGGHRPAGPGILGRRDAPGGHLWDGRGGDSDDPVSVPLAHAHAKAHSAAYPGCTTPG
jgi:hypothetical protein